MRHKEPGEMEFPNLGDKCSWPECKTLDFLPFNCSYCKQVFCKDHFSQNSHDCQCLKKIIRNHTDIKSFVCSYEGCSAFSPVEMLCQKCEKHFCLVHRYHECFDTVDDLETKKQMWSKPQQQFDESMKNVNEAINKKIKKAIQDPKKQATALKILLMRLKSKAEGPASIPETERIYFLILLPKGSIKSSKAIFVSKEWSVGKVIDSSASACKVINKNNELKAPKLRLFKRTSGCQISADTSVKINDLINKGEIMNGESLILEYVQPDKDVNNFQLVDTSQYNDSF